jgi:sigma-54 specific flagellar transcriptional regulator A
MGKFEQANRGTLFLDEIGDMPFGVQTKLLRVLENSIISKVGSSKEVKLDVRIICATHKNLEFLVEDNSFREDLLFRLNVFPIAVPSLNERSDDIPDLLNHFLKLKTKTENTKRPNFDNTAIKALKDYAWPGNIREVRNVVERSLIFFPNTMVNGEDVNKYLLSVDSGVINRTEEQAEIWSEFDELGLQDPEEHPDDRDTSPPKPEDFAKWFETNNSVDLRALLRDIEIVFIETALDRNSGNTSEAAKDLKLLRTTLIEKVKKYSL